MLLLDDVAILGLGLDLFFHLLVFFAVLEDILYEHYIVLPFDLTLLWTALFLTPAFALDATLWLGDVIVFLHRVLIANPRPLAAFLERHFPILERLRFCSRCLFRL
ncbi:hypothetical protein K449DRAFT_439662 [Hypoxylon sp. EC38]|nr:hypothetical protein K449DRAFT_439662 [Hypoxylon sp. EC38]